MENYRTLKKEIKVDTSKWKHTPSTWIRRIVIKMPILPKAIYRVNEISIKTLMVYSHELEQIFPKFTQNYKVPRITMAILRKKSKVGRITLPDLKLYHEALVIKQRMLLT